MPSWPIIVTTMATKGSSASQSMSRKGESSSISWIATQVSEKIGLRARISFTSCSRRMWCPSGLISSRSTVTVRVASATSLPRALARRNIRFGLPCRSVCTRESLKSTADWGLEALANIRPVASATKSIPAADSMVTSTSPQSLAGARLPKPTVDRVWTENANASEKRTGPSIPPMEAGSNRYSPAKSTLRNM